MENSATGRELRDLKARAQRLKPMLKIGKEGLSSGFLKELGETLTHHELVKVKFDEFKEQKKELTLMLAEKAGAQVVMKVGNVVVLFRRRVEQSSAG